MSDSEKKKDLPFISAGEEIDVNEIMEYIEKRIEEKKASGVLKQKEIEEIEDMELQPLPDFLEIPNVYEQHLFNDEIVKNYDPASIELESDGGSGAKGIMKKVFRVIRKPLMPFIRSMVRPINNELKAHINIDRNYIHQFAAGVEYIKLLHNTSNNLIVELSKLKIEEELLKTKIKVLEDKMEFLENRERAIEKKLYQ